MPALTPRNIAIGASALGVAILLFPKSAKKVSPINNPFETPAVKSVGSRYAAQGGTDTHQPGTATPLGDPDRKAPNQESLKGLGTGRFEESQGDQKVVKYTGASKKFMEANVGNDKGK